MSEEILNVEELNVSYGPNKVIENLSFKVKKGEVLIILGPNGAGKTTLLKSLLGILPYKGTIKWNTDKISYLPPQELMQRRELPPMSIMDFFKMKTNKIDEIKELIKGVGLDSSILDKGFNELSTGQFQRMTIAWALVGKPEVLLFDEPTSGIDIGGEETIYSLLHKFWKKWNLTILLVTHDLNIVWSHATNVLCINKKGMCYGPPEKVVTPKRLKELYGSEIKFYKHRVKRWH